MIYASIMRDSKCVGIYDTKSGSLLSLTYLPEPIVSVQLVSQMEIVAQSKRMAYILKRNGPTSNNFSISMIRSL